MSRLIIFVIIPCLTACITMPSKLSVLDGLEPLQSRVYDASYKETYFAAINSASGMLGWIMSRSLDTGEIAIRERNHYVAKVSVLQEGAKTRVEFRIRHSMIPKANGDIISKAYADAFLNGITDELLR